MRHKTGNLIWEGIHIFDYDLPIQVAVAFYQLCMIPNLCNNKSGSLILQCKRLFLNHKPEGGRFPRTAASHLISAVKFISSECY